MTTAKEFIENMKYADREAFCAKLECWLSEYTDDVFAHVMAQMDAIVNDPATLRLIDELYTRTQKARKYTIRSIEYTINDPGTFLRYGIHNHALEHPSAYRHVLYDMYIADRPLDQATETD